MVGLRVADGHLNRGQKQPLTPIIAADSPLVRQFCCQPL